jgi:hypothetical protein
MTPKEKAKELFDFMLYNNGDEYHHCWDYVAKNCALIAVDEILSLSKIASLRRDEVYMELEYWIEVKQEIENL